MITLSSSNFSCNCCNSLKGSYGDLYVSHNLLIATTFYHFKIRIPKIYHSNCNVYNTNTVTLTQLDGAYHGLSILLSKIRTSRLIITKSVSNNDAITFEE